MKWFPHGMRIVIASGSIAAFLGGWIMLGHSSKPVDASAQPAAAAPQNVQPAPLPNSRRSTGLQPLPSRNSTFPLPRLRTRSS